MSETETAGGGRSLQATCATHLHRPHGVKSVVMDRVPWAVCFGVSKTSNVDHIAVVEGNKHSEDTRGGMHGLLKEIRTENVMSAP